MNESVDLADAPPGALVKIGDIPDGGAVEIEHAQDSYVLIRYGQLALAYLNVCPHAGRPLNWAPGRFLLAHGQLVCAAHGASFRPEDGFCIGGPCRGQSLKPLAVRVDGEWVVLSELEPLACSAVASSQP